MKVMSVVYATKESESGAPPDPRLLAAIEELRVELEREGKILDTGGLAPSAAGKRVRVSRGKVSITDGPFTEAREIVGGYAVLNVSSMEEAVAISRRFWQLHVDVMGASYEGAGEIRQLFTSEDFGR